MTDTPTPTVFEAWSAVMHDLREIRKDDSGDGVKYRFRGVDTVMNAVGPLLRKHRVVVTPTEVTDLDIRPFSSGRGTAMVEVFLRVRYRVYGPGGDFFDGGSAGQASDASDKATAQAMSVAYRVFLLQSLTMPTDAEDPDLNQETRGAEDDSAAVALGWDSAAQRDAIWAKGVAAMKDLPDETRQSVVDWGKEQGLSKDTLTPAMSDEWVEMVKLAKNFAPEDPDPEDARHGDDEGGGEPDFDRAGAWAALHEWHGSLANQADFDRVQALLDQHGITDETLTAQQALSWRSFMEPMPTKGDQPAPTTDPKKQGWRSKAERKKQYDSLVAATTAILAYGHVTPAMAEAHQAEYAVAEEDLTKAHAVRWHEANERLAMEPF